MTTTITLRLAQSNEFKLINDIKLKADERYGNLLRPRPLHPARLKISYEKKYLYIMQNNKGDPMGFVLYQKKDGALFIDQASTLPQYQGQKLGSLILDHAIAVAKRAKLRKITFTTNNDIPWCRPYFETLGFRVLQESDLTPELAETLKAEQERGKLKRVAMGLDI